MSCEDRLEETMRGRVSASIVSSCAWCVLVVMLMSAAACGTDGAPENSGDTGGDGCPDGQVADSSGTCVPVDAGTPDGAATDTGDTGTTGVDTGTDTGTTPDTGGDTGSDTASGDTNGPDASHRKKITWEDNDRDGHLHDFDNCPGDANPDQRDKDHDGVGNACDNCPGVANHTQKDSDKNDVGDACEPAKKCEKGASYDAKRDCDGDGVRDLVDNCIATKNPKQDDPDKDGLGSACDNCPDEANYDQRDKDKDGVGNACEKKPAGKVCARQSQGFKEVRPNLYVVLDKSGSMKGGKMKQAKKALDAIADQLSGQFRFGMLAYSDSCHPPERLSMDQHTSKQIKRSYRSVIPGGSTATGGALRTVRQRRLFWNPKSKLRKLRPKAVVLITDGDANTCGGQRRAEIEAKKLFKDHNVAVYVIGFKFGASPTNLDAIAKKGGTMRHFKANSTATLVSAVKNISNDVITCSYKLKAPSQGIDPAKIWVKIDGTYAKASEYSYDDANQTLTLTNSACKRLRKANPKNPTSPLEIVLGCPSTCKTKSKEVCDYKDNNCDGKIDEGCETCSPEICDGKDNDCDGDTDELCPMCTAPGDKCSSHAACCNNHCKRDGTCGEPCRPNGTICAEDADCCSGICASRGGSRFGQCIDG